MTPALLDSCIKDGACELNQTPLAATQFLNSQNISWNSVLVPSDQEPDLKAVQTCLSAHSNDASGFMNCSEQIVLGAAGSAVQCRETSQDDRALAACLLQTAGLNVSALKCPLEKIRHDPSTCLTTTISPEWLQATQCLAQHSDPLDAVNACHLIGSDPNVVKIAKCLSANHARAADSLSCVAEWPALGNQAKIVQCLLGKESGKNALLKCGTVAGIHLDPTVVACLQSQSTAAASWITSCLAGVNNPTVACFAKFSDSNDDIMTCLANGNPTTRDALAAVRCITSENDASDLIASCTEGLIKDPKARQALACAALSG